MRRQQLVYILICLILGAIGFSFGMALLPDEWFGSEKKKGEIIEVFYFQANYVEKSVLGSGWSRSEGWGIWSDGAKSTLAIDLQEPSLGDLELEFVIKPFIAGRHHSQRVEVSVNETKMDTWVLLLSKQWQSQRVRIPKNIWDAKRPAEVTFIYTKPRSEVELGIGKDSRRLTMGLRTLTIRNLY